MWESPWTGKLRFLIISSFHTFAEDNKSLPHSLFSKIYDWYSFNIIPKLGKLLANDSESYQYLAESIRMHPDQETLKDMIIDSGFNECKFFNLVNGIVAIHKAK